MTKKRIADLLKEEVEKPAQGKPKARTASGESATKARTRKRASAKSASTASGGAASGGAASGGAKSASTKSASTKSASTKSASTKSTAQTPATVSVTATSVVETSSSEKAVPEKVVTEKAVTEKETAATTATAVAAKNAEKERAALSQKVSELETALKKSTAQVVALQEDIDTHQSRIFELKDSLEKTESDSKKKDTQLEKLTAELAEAKQVILNLSKVEATPPVEATVKEAAPLAKAQSPRQSLSIRRAPYSSYKSIPEYAIQRGTPTGGQNNSMLNDDDIGWVD